MNPMTLYLSITRTLLWYPTGPIPLSVGSEKMSVRVPNKVGITDEMGDDSGEFDDVDTC